MMEASQKDDNPWSSVEPASHTHTASDQVDLQPPPAQEVVEEAETVLHAVEIPAKDQPLEPEPATTIDPPQSSQPEQPETTRNNPAHSPQPPTLTHSSLRPPESPVPSSPASSSTPASPSKPKPKRKPRQKTKQEHVLVSVTEDNPVPDEETPHNSFFFTHASLAVPEVTGYGTLRWALENTLKNGDVVTIVNARRAPIVLDRSPEAFEKAKHKDEEGALIRVTQAVSDIISKSKRNLDAVIIAIEYGSESEVIISLAKDKERAITKVVMRDKPTLLNIFLTPQTQLVCDGLLGVCPVILVSDTMIKLLGHHHTISDEEDGDEANRENLDDCWDV